VTSHLLKKNCGGFFFLKLLAEGALKVARIFLAKPAHGVIYLLGEEGGSKQSVTKRDRVGEGSKIV